MFFQEDELKMYEICMLLSALKISTCVDLSAHLMLGPFPTFPTWVKSPQICLFNSNQHLEIPLELRGFSGRVS